MPTSREKSRYEPVDTPETEAFNHFTSNNKHSTAAPCRACTDFKSWAKAQTSYTKGKPNSKGSPESDTSQSGTAEHPMTATKSQLHILGNNCPLDKDQLGYQTWGLLHTMAAYYPDHPTDRQRKDMSKFFVLLSRFYPCETCAKDFSDMISIRPPVTTSQESLSQWLCWAHNNVNYRLGKPLFDCSRVNERWRDGWTDGSCDP
ncbi:unnamed protein product [Bemisia tabaci]|uniref:Sulfhydryl oxidase n=1 Tax=Bemisia tabaci TaxID=7038 RepID=A0A9P0G588_BEMTA|nr:unnamed protein product [Bemisia tabaci]